jgi:hypothetical protein
MKRLLDRFWLPYSKLIPFASEAKMLQVGGAAKCDDEVLWHCQVMPDRARRVGRVLYQLQWVEKLMKYHAKGGLMTNGVHAVVARSQNPKQLPVLLLMMLNDIVACGCCLDVRLASPCGKTDRASSV